GRNAGREASAVPAAGTDMVAPRLHAALACGLVVLGVDDGEREEDQARDGAGGADLRRLVPAGLEVAVHLLAGGAWFDVAGAEGAAGGEREEEDEEERFHGGPFCGVSGSRRCRGGRRSPGPACSG